MKKIVFVLILLTTIIGSVCIYYGADRTSKETYVKFQDRMSMDWDEGEYLLWIAQVKGGSVEDRAYTILVTLNRCVEESKSIKTIVLCELCSNGTLTPVELENIIPDEKTIKAYNMIVYDKFDNSYGSIEYK